MRTIPILKCPYCSFKRGARFPTKRDKQIHSLPEDSPIYWVAGWHTIGIGKRRCLKCNKDIAVVFCSDVSSVYASGYGYTLDSDTGKTVTKMLGE